MGVRLFGSALIRHPSCESSAPTGSEPVMGTNDQEPQASPKVSPERVALRASPRAVTRLNRRMLAVLAGTLAVAVSVGAFWALHPKGSRRAGDTTQSYNVDHVAKAEELDRLPPDYSKL